jgi:hypothetical protein
MASKRTARSNIRKRGGTYTYYVYGTGPDGTRKQYSQGGFATQKEALAAQTRANAALLDGSYVADERQTFASFLVDEWLPTKRPPTLEESTFRSYERNLRLHVIPNVGAVRLAGLTPMHLNQLYRNLLDSGRVVPTTTRRRFGDDAVSAALQLVSEAGPASRSPTCSTGSRRSGSKASPATLWRPCCDATPRSVAPGRSAGRALAQNGAVHPHHHPCCSSGCCPLEQGRPQHRRLGNPSPDLGNPGQAHIDLDRTAGPPVLRVRGRIQVPTRMAVPRNVGLSPGRSARPAVVRRRP